MKIHFNCKVRHLGKGFQLGQVKKLTFSFKNNQNILNSNAI